MFRKYIARNIIALTVPIIIIEFFILIIALNLSVLDKYSSYRIDYVDNGELNEKIEKYYSEGKVNVTFSCPSNMDNAGYDYKVGGETKGKCFYNFLGDSLRVYILSDSNAERLENGDKPVLHARLEERHGSVNSIKKEYEDELGLQSGTMDSYLNDIIVNEVDYPALRMDILKYAKYIAVGMMAISFLYMIIAILFPFLNICFKVIDNKSGYSRKELIKLANEELKKDGVIDYENGMYQTEHFLIRVYISYTDLSIIEE